MKRIDTFKSFTDLRNQLREEQKMQELSSKIEKTTNEFAELLKKYNVASVSEISEEQLPEFMAELLGEAKPAADKAKYDRTQKAMAYAKELKAKKEKEAKAAALTKAARRYQGVKESVNESAYTEKIKFVMQNSTSSFKNLGNDFKKAGLKYNFYTAPFPHYVVEPGGNKKVAIVSRKNEYDLKGSDIQYSTYIATMTESVELVEEGTRGFFGKIDKNGNITAVYTHYDSYPENMLPTIKKGYMDLKNVEAVIAKGDNSGLKADINKMNFYGDNNKPLIGSVDKADAFIKNAKKEGAAEFVYLYDERSGTWMMADTQRNQELVPAFESFISEAQVDLLDAVSDKIVDLYATLNDLAEETTDTSWRKALEAIIKNIEGVETTVNKFANKLGVIPTHESAEVNENMELKKLEDAIKMFQDKIKSQGRVTNARDEDHLENLIRIYKEMGGKNIKESAEVTESHFKVGDKVKMSHGGTGVIVSLDKEDGTEDEKYYNVELPNGEVHKHSPSELTKESVVNEANWGTYDTPEGKMVSKDLDKAWTTFAKTVDEAHKEWLKVVNNYRGDAGKGSGFHDDEGRDSVISAMEWYIEKVFMADRRFGGIDYKKYRTLLGESVETEVNEAEINSAEEFKAYAEKVLKKAHGADYDEAKAKEAIEGILAKVDGDFGAAVGMLTSGLGESVEVSEGAKEEQRAMELYVSMVDPKSGRYSEAELEKMDLDQIEDLLGEEGLKGSELKKIAAEFLQIAQG